MSTFIELLKEGYPFAWGTLIIIVIMGVLGSLTIYWIATGTDAISVDNKNWNEAKKSCDNLKSYLLNHYDEIHYNQALVRWNLVCNK